MKHFIKKRKRTKQADYCIFLDKNIINHKKVIRVLLILLLFFSVLLYQYGCKDNAVSPVLNGDSAWTFLGLGNEWITSIAVDPTNSNIIYTGSRYDFSSGTPGRLFKSTDNGKTWDTLILDYGAIYSSIIIEPQSTNIIYVASLKIIKSNDGGITWSEKDKGITIISEEVGVETLVMDPKNSNILYAGTGGPMGGTMYKTTDGGTNWSNIGGDSLGDGVISIAIDHGNTNTIYAGTAGACIIWKSTDAGQSWERTGMSENGLIESICINPANTEQIYAGTALRGGVAIWESKDGGNSWSTSIRGLPSGVTVCNRLIFNPSEQFDLYECGEGVYDMNNQNSSWTEMDNGLPNSRVDLLVLDKDFNLYAGLQTLDTAMTGGIYRRRIVHR